MKRASIAFVVLAILACASPRQVQTVASPAVAVPADPAQPSPSPPVEAKTPLDPQITLGHLPNGLTYYVMKHKKPETRASLFLAVNAGSVLEDEDQRGLAHFVEHMAFNGTKRFPKLDIVNYIEKVGMRFGADVNAYTSFDQTVYMLTVPTDDKSVMLKGLDILRDWAGDVSFDPVEVDKERGVVLEEWRLGRGPFARINDKQYPVIFEGSRYGKRLPIGDPQIVKTAKRDTLVRFYKDWYRPDNMAVIAIGDFDPADLEKEIRARFGDLANPTRERAREVIAVPHDHETLVTIASDHEMPFTSVAVYDKMDHRDQETKTDYRRLLVERLYHTMLGARFDELRLAPDAPFTAAQSSTFSFARGGDLFGRNAEAKAGRAAEALAVLFREIARVEKFGFLPSELERARRDVLSRSENEAKEWDKTPSSDIADEATRHFFTGEQMPGRALELAYTRELLPTITLDELNHLARTWGGERGRVIAVSGSANQKLPGEDEVRAIAKQASSAPIEAWKDADADRPLMKELPRPEKVAATAHDDATGTTVWTLSNGVKVVVKPTTFQNDEVKLIGFQSGGTSLLTDAEYDQVRFHGLVTSMGVADLDPIALKKLLAGKVVELSLGFDELSEYARGSARPQDLETMLQLLYLRATAPRKDERAFAAWKQEEMEWVEHKSLLPEVQFFDQLRPIVHGDHHRHRPDTPELLAKVDVDKALAIYKQRFADMGQFTFIIVGNVELPALQPLVERYLGSLPSKGRKEHWKDIGVRYPTRMIKKDIVAGTEPKARVQLTMSAPDKWSVDLDRDAKILSMVLRIRLREVLREDMGGVYHVSIGAGISREPTQRRTMSISFGCDPENVDKLRAAAFDEIAKVVKDGIGSEYLDKVREQLRRERETDLKENEWWVSNLRDSYWNGDDFAKVNDLDAMLARVTGANVKIAAKHFFTPNNYILGVMKPKAAGAPRP
jgi:zinc protease